MPYDNKKSEEKKLLKIVKINLKIFLMKNKQKNDAEKNKINEIILMRKFLDKHEKYFIRNIEQNCFNFLEF